MISAKHSTVFVHIPKTAGQSVELAFLNDLNLTWKKRDALLLRHNDNRHKGPPRLAHLVASDYVSLEHISAQDWERFYSFAVVRQPFTRTVSLYRHLGPEMSFHDWVMGFLSKNLSGADGLPIRWFVQPQADYLCDAGGRVLVKDVLRFEKLASEFTRAATASGLKDHMLPRRNTTDGKPQPDIEGRATVPTRLLRSLRRRLGVTRFQNFSNWRDYFDAQTVARVRDLYARDFEIFDYDRADPRT